MPNGCQSDDSPRPWKAVSWFDRMVSSEQVSCGWGITVSFMAHLSSFAPRTYRVCRILSRFARRLHRGEHQSASLTDDSLACPGRCEMPRPHRNPLLCGVGLAFFSRRPSQVKSRDQLSPPRVAAQRVEGASGIARGRGGECPRRGSPPVL